ncbi:DUF362 domain-containing protein [Halobaculum sp. P14]|uniref:DUF362 domain-containing protein n=1 Tax=Halobaculum sp. P14 TaxID=3421638 RepID=UPI003EBFF4C7
MQRWSLLSVLRPANTLLPFFRDSGPMESTVSLVCGDDRTSNVAAALDRVCDDVAAALPADADVVVKPNLVKPRPLACTHVDTVDAVLSFFEELGVAEFTVAESSAARISAGILAAYSSRFLILTGSVEILRELQVRPVV